MAQTRRRYTRELKIEAVRLLETSGKSATQIERELGIGQGNRWRWKREFGPDSEQIKTGPGGRTPEQERIRELERENEFLRQKRDILRNAVAIFSQPKP